MPNCRDTVDEAIVPSRSACPSIRVQCIHISSKRYNILTSHSFFFYVGSRETSQGAADQYIKDARPGSYFFFAYKYTSKVVVCCVFPPLVLSLAVMGGRGVLLLFHAGLYRSVQPRHTQTHNRVAMMRRQPTLLYAVLLIEKESQLNCC